MTRRRSLLPFLAVVHGIVLVMEIVALVLVMTEPAPAVLTHADGHVEVLGP